MSTPREVFAAAVLVASDVRLAAVVEQNLAGFFEASLDGRLIRFNAFFKAVTGRQAEALAGATLQSMTDREYRDRTTGILQQLLAGGPPQVLNTRFERPDGALVEARIWLKLLRDADGRPVQYLGLLLDETERMQRQVAEENLRQLNLGLEELVLRRTAEANAANVAKSQFLANMSHELRTPLNAVLGLAQLLERGALSSEHRRIVGSIRAAGRLLGSTIDSILDFSKLEAGELELEQVPLDFDRLLNQVLDMMGTAARDKGLLLTLDAQPVRHAVLGDALRIEQMLLNLLSNAIKFTERGSVTLRLRELNVDADRVRLRVEVTDTGIGIDPQVLPNLFSPFAQADPSIGRRYGGTGLGLSICRELVTLMGGSIGADSEPGRGSTFWFEVPLQRTAAAPRMSSVVAAPSAPVGPRLAGLRVLAVDDSRLNLEVVERALAMEGATTVLATDGQQALNLLRAQPDGFDLVLMDLHMPVLDGFAATREIRREPQFASLTVVAFTAALLGTQIEDARRAGVDDFIAKPVELDDLVAVIARWAPVVRVRGPAAAVQSLTVDADLPVIDGIDAQRAGEAIGHDRDLFLSLCRQFVGRHADAADQVRAQLAADNTQGVLNLLHGLRGNAGHLGAIDLSREIQALEDALRRGESAAAASLPRFESQLIRLLAALRGWLATVQTPTSVAPAAGAAPDERLAVLRSALQVHDLAALDCFATLRGTLVAALGVQQVDAMDAALQSLQFDTVLARLPANLAVAAPTDVA